MAKNCPSNKEDHIEQIGEELTRTSSNNCSCLKWKMSKGCILSLLAKFLSKGWVKSCFILFMLFSLLISIYVCIKNGNRKEDLFVALGLGMSFSIFIYQQVTNFISNREKEKNDKKNSENQQQLLQDIRKIVLEFRPFKEASDIIDNLKIWSKESENTFIFYFPYTLCPGFWIDGGIGFLGYLNELESTNTNTNQNNFILIGPSMPESIQEDSVVDKIITKMVEKKVSRDKINQKLLDVLNNDLSNQEIIKNTYKQRIERILHVSKIKGSIYIFDSEKNTPHINSSFVIRISKNRVHDIFFIDTFNLLSASVTQMIDLTNDSDLIESDDRLNLLFKSPPGRLINNTKITNLFFSMFLELYQNEELNRILKK